MSTAKFALTRLREKGIYHTMCSRPSDCICRGKWKLVDNHGTVVYQYKKKVPFIYAEYKAECMQSTRPDGTNCECLKGPPPYDPFWRRAYYDPMKISLFFYFQ